MAAATLLTLLVLTWLSYELYVAPILDEEGLLFQPAAAGSLKERRPRQRPEATAPDSIETDRRDGPPPRRGSSETYGAA